MHLIWLRWLLFIFHSFSCLGSWLMRKVCDLSSLTFYEQWAHLVGMRLWICEWNRSSHVYDSRAYSNWALCTYWLNDSLSIESCFFQLDLSWTVTFLFASTSHARGYSNCEQRWEVDADNRFEGKESFIAVLVQSTNTQVAKCKLAIVYLQLFNDTFRLKGTAAAAAAINIEEANDTTQKEKTVWLVRMCPSKRRNTTTHRLICVWCMSLSTNDHCHSDICHRKKSFFFCHYCIRWTLGNRCEFSNREGLRIWAESTSAVPE